MIRPTFEMANGTCSCVRCDHAGGCDSALRGGRTRSLGLAIPRRVRLASWSDFKRDAPDLAEAARGLLYQYGIGLGYLATVRADGGPRLHPICPIISTQGLHAFIVPSPKRRDLDRDGRFALHAFSPEEVDDECYLTGRARAIYDPAVREVVAEAYHHDPGADEVLYELDIERCLIARYESRGQWPPAYSTWVDPTSFAGG